MSIGAMKRVVEAFDALPPDHPARYANLQINLLRTAIQQATQPAEVTDEQIESCALEAGFSVESTGSIWAVDGYVGTRVDPGLRKFAKAILALRPVQVPMTCHCQTCRPITITDMRMVLCPKCGNKRCPHANDHRNACTGSNEPGQPGSAYPAHHGITAQAKKGGDK